ncbi:hypothetical protein [Maridesulfovibrio zosterae]|uniref:hypothetical protein n=1 Tax=Maridesulfovibrio zosterae TaxID=82171 RepID=UPI0004185E8E|nr:hypothetical protein [Maridesulfovibrio zosterae]
MNTRTILSTILILIFTAMPVMAQEDCSSIFKTELESVPGIKAVVQDQNGFLTILNSDNKTDVIKAVSAIKNLRKSNQVKQCDFSGVAVVIMDSNFELTKSATSTLNKTKISKLLYKYIYALSPVEVEENLHGYEKLSELSPQNRYYAERIKHYTKRINLIKSRNNFITKCLSEIRKNKNIADLKIKKDFYLFITETETPLASAEKFLNKMAKSTPKPDKDLCIISYSKNLEKKETSCPAEYENDLANNEEELLMHHVQSIPSYKIQENINGYAALKKLNPSSTLYTGKYEAYKAKQKIFDKFVHIKTAAGNNIFTKTNPKGSILFATINNNAVNGKSKSTNKRLFETLASYYQRAGSPYPKCVLKNTSGETLGIISCNKNGCNFKQ